MLKGAQLCGLTGQESEIRFDRISALDPAGPFFEYADGRVSVDKSDAEFVDVMHTNGGELLQSRFGMIRPCGHIDFYVNGGVFQPGCPNLLQITIGCLTNFEACKGGKTLINTKIQEPLDIKLIFFILRSK